MSPAAYVLLGAFVGFVIAALLYEDSLRQQRRTIRKLRGPHD